MNPLVDKALKLHQESENARQEAITSLLGEQKAIGDQLKALGHVVGQKAPVKAEPAKPKSAKKCPVCSSDEHDGRFHRASKTTAPVTPPTSTPRSASEPTTAK
jgi:hypothetical protein